MDLREFSEEGAAELVRSLDGGVGAAEYQRLSAARWSHPLTRRLAALDPFSAEYHRLATELYLDLRGRRDGYDPERDERSGLGAPVGNPHADVSPWSFRDAGFCAEFLYAWGQIFRLLEVGAGQRVLEYGPGSGQILLMLARAGVRAFGVDIDQGSLGQVRAQAQALGVEVATERAVFGEGFGAERFDRIVFFEAFHHALRFEDLLLRLHERLAPGGRVVFCGEPVVSGVDPAVPAPWGPRLDSLSIYCIRRYGWMELGFQHDTFVEALQRTGWRVVHHPFPLAGRASAYVAEPVWGATELGRPLALGRFEAGWDAPEGTHRWTRGDAGFPLPVRACARVDVALRVSNYLPHRKRLRVSDGLRAAIEVTMESGDVGREVRLAGCEGRVLRIHCDAHQAPGADPRRLGVAVHDVTIAPAASG